MAREGCRTCGGRTATGGQTYIVDAGTVYSFELLDGSGARIERYRSAIAAATAQRGRPGSTVHVLNPSEPVS